MPSTQSESRCCNKCKPISSMPFGSKGPDHCIDSACPCHTPPQEGWIEVVDNRFGRTIQTLNQNRNWQGDKGQYILDPELVELNLVSLRDDIRSFVRTTIASELELYKKGLVEKLKKMGNPYDIDSSSTFYSGFEQSRESMIAIIKNN